ncbi:MAG TPA: hypothetical protein VGN37_00815, partial [Actinocatenispora sp.]
AREPVAAAPAGARTGRHARSEARPATWAEATARAVGADTRSMPEVTVAAGLQVGPAEPGTDGPAPESAAPAVWHDTPVGWGDAPDPPSGDGGRALRVREALFHPPATRPGPTVIPDAPGRARRRAAADETRTDQFPTVPIELARTNGHGPDTADDQPVLGTPPAGRGVRGS